MTHCCASQGDWSFPHPAVSALGTFHFMFVHSFIYPTITCQEPQVCWALGTQTWVRKTDSKQEGLRWDTSHSSPPLLARL